MKQNLDNLFNLLFAGLITLCVSMLAKIDHWPVILGIFLLSYPWKIQGNIFSLFGGVNCSGSVYSLCPLIQISKESSWGIIGLTILQKAGKNAVLVVGTCLFQRGKLSFTIIGIIISQKAEKNCSLGAGVIFNQGSDGQAACNLGMVFFQKAKDEAYVGFGIPIFQKAAEFGIDWDKADEITAAK